MSPPPRAVSPRRFRLAHSRKAFQFFSPPDSILTLHTHTPHSTPSAHQRQNDGHSVSFPLKVPTILENRCCWYFCVGAAQKTSTQAAQRMLRTIIGLLLSAAVTATATLSHTSPDIIVTWVGGHDCKLEFLGQTMRCALGKNGVTRSKREGDGKTPIGTFPLRRAFYRQDKTNTTCFSVASHLNCEATLIDFGWVDAPTDMMYNRFVLLPYKDGSVSHENLYLADSAVYDLLAVIGYNDDPVVPYAGSAIFFHVASEGYGATAGCISLALADLAFVLSRVTAETRFVVTDGS